MKKTIVIVSIIFSIAAAGANFVYDKFTQLTSQISNLKTINKNLQTKNNALTKKQKDIKNKISQRKKELYSQKLSRAKKKLGKATVSAIPFIGTASVVGMTYWEMQNYCNDIKEFKKFEESIFGEYDQTISVEEKAICGYDYETIENIVLKDLNEFEADTKNWASKTYDQWNNNLDSELNRIKNEFIDTK